MGAITAMGGTRGQGRAGLKLALCPFVLSAGSARILTLNDALRLECE